MLRTLVIGLVGLLLARPSRLVAYVALQPAAKPPARSRRRRSPSSPPPTRCAPAACSSRAISACATSPRTRSRRVRQPDSAEARNALVGAMVRRMLGEHEVIASDDVLRPGDRGFLAAVLAPGSRAISVEVDAVSGEAGLIWPGDRVDLILTQTIEGTDHSLAHRVSGETMLGDVRVIAVDQQLVQGGQASGLLQNHGPTSRTITLEVTPRDSARIAVATRLGKLLVVLRAAQPQALADAERARSARNRRPACRRAIVADATRAAGPVWGGDVSRALGTDSAAPAAEVRLYQGTKQVEAYKF